MKKLIILISIFNIFFWGCTPQEAPKHGHSHGNDGHEEHNDHQEEIKLSANQIKTIGLEYGSFQQIKVSNYIKASGQLDLPPNNVIAIHAPQAGFVQQSNYLVGDKVQKGQVLTTLAHPSYIQLQQKYLEAYSQFQFLEKELERQKELNKVNANAEKKLQEVQSNYLSTLANKNALAEQLKFMGISISALQQGKITSKIDLKAPSDGYITHMNIHKGLFVKPEEELFEIVDNDHMHIELQIFEKDLFKLKKGQKISFTLPAISDKVYDAKVYLIGQSFDNESKTVQVHGHLIHENPKFIKGLFTDAKVWLDEQTVNALPSKAVIQEKGKAFIFVKKEDSKHQHKKKHNHHKHNHAHSETHFEKVPVKIIAEEGDFIGIEPLIKLDKNAKIVTEGAFFLTSELRKSEAGHGHSH